MTAWRRTRPQPHVQTQRQSLNTQRQQQDQQQNRWTGNTIQNPGRLHDQQGELSQRSQQQRPRDDPAEFPGLDLAPAPNSQRAQREGRRPLQETQKSGHSAHGARGGLAPPQQLCGVGGRGIGGNASDHQEQQQWQYQLPTTGYGNDVIPTAGYGRVYDEVQDQRRISEDAMKMLSRTKSSERFGVLTNPADMSTGGIRAAAAGTSVIFPRRSAQEREKKGESDPAHPIGGDSTFEGHDQPQGKPAPPSIGHSTSMGQDHHQHLSRSDQYRGGDSHQDRDRDQNRGREWGRDNDPRMFQLPSQPSRDQSATYTLSADTSMFATAHSLTTGKQLSCCCHFSYFLIFGFVHVNQLRLVLSLMFRVIANQVTGERL